MLISTIGTQRKQENNFNMQLYLESELHTNELIPTKPHERTNPNKTT